MTKKDLLKPISFEADRVKFSSGLFSDFVVCTAELMHDGINRNWSDIPKQALQEALPTFVNKPVLASIQKKKENLNDTYVGGHDMDVAIDADGEEYISYLEGERPVGVITNESEISIKTKKDGKSWVVAKLFLWKQYNPELIKILSKDKTKKISVEIQPLEVEEYEHDLGTIFRITKFSFLGVTILGHWESYDGDLYPIEEGMKGAHLTVEEYGLAYSEARQKKLNLKKIDRFLKQETDGLDYSKFNIFELLDEELGEESVLGDNFNILQTNIIKNNVSAIVINNTDYSLFKYEGEINTDETLTTLSLKEIHLDGKQDIVDLYRLSLIKEDLKKEKYFNVIDLIKEEEVVSFNQLIYKILNYSNYSELLKGLYGSECSGYLKSQEHTILKGLVFEKIREKEYLDNFIENIGKENRVERFEYELEGFLSIASSKEFSYFIKDGAIYRSPIKENYLAEELELLFEDSELSNIFLKHFEVDIDNKADDKTNTVDPEGTTIPVSAEEDAGKEDIDNIDNVSDDADKDLDSVDKTLDSIDENLDDANKDPDNNQNNVDNTANIDPVGDSDNTANTEDENKDTMIVLERDNLLIEKEVLLSEKEELAKKVEEFELKVQALEEEIQEMKDKNFEKIVIDELNGSLLETEEKEIILHSLKEGKISTIEDIRKEIAYIEKTTNKNTQNFSIPLDRTRKPVEEESIFKKLLK